MSDTDTGLRPQEGTLAGGVFYRHWTVDDPRAVVLLVHGLAEHGGRYQHVAEALAKRSIASYAPDHLGHGRSPGRRCHIRQFAEFYAPLDALRDAIDERYPGLPCFIVGHSLGGLITGNYLLGRQQRFIGAAFSAAAFDVPEPPAPLALFINRLLAMIWPTLGVLQLEATEISRDPEVVRRYAEDPLVHSGKVSARLVVELFSAMETLRERRRELELPVLVMHGEGDVMTPPWGSQQFAADLGSTDQRLRIYAKLYHEIFNEPEREQVLADLLDWLDEHIPEA